MSQQARKAANASHPPPGRRSPDYSGTVPGAARATARNVVSPLLIVLALALTIAVGVPVGSAAAAVNPSRSTYPSRAINPSQLQWLVKSNDLAALDQQAGNDGVALPAFTWVGCGGQSDVFPCQSGQVPIFTSYVDLAARANAGWHGTAVFDIEPWTFTPLSERKDPNKWICKAAQLQQTDPQLKVIITPFRRPPNTGMISEDAEAAKCGAYAVDVQSQFANTVPARFRMFIRMAVRAIRAANPNTEILAGLATNNPNLVTATDMTADYYSALAAGVQGFWLNANDWFSRNQCTAAEGGFSCPETGIQFLEAIGMITAGPVGSTPSPGSTTSTPTPGVTTSTPAAGPTTSKPTAGTGATPSRSANDRPSGSRGSAALQQDFVRLFLQSPLTRLTELAGGLVGGIAVIAACGCDAWVAEDLLLREVHRA